MHTRDLALSLRCFAALSEFDRSQELHQLAAFLDRGRDEAISSRLKRLPTPRKHPARLKATIEAIVAALRASGAGKPSSTFNELLTLFQGHAGASVEDFFVELAALPPPQPGTTRRFRTANSRLANDICNGLVSKLEDARAFSDHLDQLVQTSPAGTATWTLVANRLIGNRRTYRDRKSAVRAIKIYVERLAEFASAKEDRPLQFRR